MISPTPGSTPGQEDFAKTREIFQNAMTQLATCQPWVTVPEVKINALSKLYDLELEHCKTVFKRQHKMDFRSRLLQLMTFSDGPYDLVIRSFDWPQIEHCLKTQLLSEKSVQRNLRKLVQLIALYNQCGSEVPTRLPSGATAKLFPKDSLSIPETIARPFDPVNVMQKCKLDKLPHPQKFLEGLCSLNWETWTTNPLVHDMLFDRKSYNRVTTRTLCRPGLLLVHYPTQDLVVRQVHDKKRLIVETILLKHDAKAKTFVSGWTLFGEAIRFPVEYDSALELLQTHKSNVFETSNSGKLHKLYSHLFKTD